MPAALILGLKRQSGQWPETFQEHDYGTFLPARDFSYSILEFRQKKKKREASATLARVEVRVPQADWNSCHTGC